MTSTFIPPETASSRPQARSTDQARDEASRPLAATGRLSERAAGLPCLLVGGGVALAGLVALATAPRAAVLTAATLAQGGMLLLLASLIIAPRRLILFRRVGRIVLLAGATGLLAMAVAPAGLLRLPPDIIPGAVPFALLLLMAILPIMAGASSLCDLLVPGRAPPVPNPLRAGIAAGLHGLMLGLSVALLTGSFGSLSPTQDASVPIVLGFLWLSAGLLLADLRLTRAYPGLMRAPVAIAIGMFAGSSTAVTGEMLLYGIGHPGFLALARGADVQGSSLALILLMLLQSVAVGVATYMLTGTIVGRRAAEARARHEHALRLDTEAAARRLQRAHLDLDALFALTDSSLTRPIAILRNAAQRLHARLAGAEPPPGTGAPLHVEALELAEASRILSLRVDGLMRLPHLDRRPLTLRRVHMGRLLREVLFVNRGALEAEAIAVEMGRTDAVVRADRALLSFALIQAFDHAIGLLRGTQAPRIDIDPQLIDGEVSVRFRARRGTSPAAPDGGSGSGPSRLSRLLPFRLSGQRVDIATTNPDNPAIAAIPGREIRLDPLLPPTALQDLPGLADTAPDPLDLARRILNRHGGQLTFRTDAAEAVIRIVIPADDPVGHPEDPDGTGTGTCGKGADSSPASKPDDPETAAPLP